VQKDTGINDGLNDVEKAVTFIPKAIGKELEIIHSLAKWKRVMVGHYKCSPYSGIITNMRAIRQDENLSNIHSILVDQWDWERVIPHEERHVDTLK
jgi:aspartate--ammonia ligase